MAAIEKCLSAFIETTVDDEVVIVSLDKGHFFSLKDTGLVIWRKIDGSRSRDDILSELKAEFDADAEVLTRDLDEFLSEVSAVGFVQQG